MCTISKKFIVSLDRLQFSISISSILKSWKKNDHVENRYVDFFLKARECGQILFTDYSTDLESLYV